MQDTNVKSGIRTIDSGSVAGTNDVSATPRGDEKTMPFSRFTIPLINDCNSKIDMFSVDNKTYVRLPPYPHLAKKKMMVHEFARPASADVTTKKEWVFFNIKLRPSRSFSRFLFRMETIHEAECEDEDIDL